MKKITFMIGFLLLLLAAKAIEANNEQVVTNVATEFAPTSFSLPKTGDLTSFYAAPVRPANYRAERCWGALLLPAVTVPARQKYSISSMGGPEDEAVATAYLALLYPHHNFW